MIEQVSKFYLDLNIPQIIDGSKDVAVIHPLTRTTFLKGFVIALAYSVQKIVQTVLSYAGILLTSGTIKENHTRDFFSRWNQSLIYLSATPIGLAGCLFPQTINEYFLNIPPIK